MSCKWGDGKAFIRATYEKTIEDHPTKNILNIISKIDREEYIVFKGALCINKKSASKYTTHERWMVDS